MRPHISLNVRHVGRSVAFYEKVFGVSPQKKTADYAKFDLNEPPLNFSLLSSGGRISEVNHLGIELADAEAVAAWHNRLLESGVVERIQKNVTCCFARQDKVWFTDPDGNNWEIFCVHEQLPVKGPLAETGCCSPNASKDIDASAEACGCR